MKILIVEDEVVLQKEIVAFLSAQGHHCEYAMTYFEAEDKLAVFDYDITVLDLTLPGGDGLDLLKLLKHKNPETGTIIISAKNSLDDKLTGLDIGADDYITKPFHLTELNARINALFRRKFQQGDFTLSIGEIVIDTHAKSVTVSGKTADFTPKEFDLLLYLVINKNQVLSKQSIAEHLWGDDFEADNYDFLYVHINNLRKKLMDAGARDPIKTVYGLGYRFAL